MLWVLTQTPSHSACGYTSFLIGERQFTSEEMAADVRQIFEPVINSVVTEQDPPRLLFCSYLCVHFL